MQELDQHKETFRRPKAHWSVWAYWASLVLAVSSVVLFFAAPFYDFSVKTGELFLVTAMGLYVCTKITKPIKIDEKLSRAEAMEYVEGEIYTKKGRLLSLYIAVPFFVLAICLHFFGY